MLCESKLNANVKANFSRVGYGYLIVPFLLLIGLYFYIIFFNSDSNDAQEYVDIQRNVFFFLNGKLSRLYLLQYNLTQLGDALIFASFLTFFILYAPKIWEALLTSAIISSIASVSLKNLLSVPRPAAMFEEGSFTIIGETLRGHNSCPSGHTIFVFVVMTILLYSFMPRKSVYKIMWYCLIIAMAYIIALSRVGVGAHYPLDVFIGSAIGYSAAIVGIRLNDKIHLFRWVNDRKYLPISIILIIIWIGAIVYKIFKVNIIIFYIALIALLVALYLISKTYVQRKN